jgi:hypothetical protein
VKNAPPAAAVVAVNTAAAALAVANVTDPIWISGRGPVKTGLRLFIFRFVPIASISPARVRCGASGLQETGEICLVTPEQEKREGGDNERNGQSFVIHENVEAEDVHNHRAEQREAERNVAADQKNQSTRDLAESDNIEIARAIHRIDEVARRP